MSVATETAPTLPFIRSTRNKRCTTAGQPLSRDQLIILKNIQNAENNLTALDIENAACIKGDALINNLCCLEKRGFILSFAKPNDYSGEVKTYSITYAGQRVDTSKVPSKKRLLDRFLEL